MPRKKNGRPSKSQKNTFVSYKKLEKDFLNTPVKLNKHLSAEIKSLKQFEKKLKNVLSKNNTQIKSAEKRIVMAEKNDTAAGKKQVRNTEKLRNNLIKEQSILTNQLELNSKAIDRYTEAQQKLNALREQLTNFDRDWTKESKKTRAKKAETNIPKKRANKINTVIPTTTQDITSHAEPQVSFENTRPEEEVEVLA